MEDGHFATFGGTAGSSCSDPPAPFFLCILLRTQWTVDPDGVQTLRPAVSLCCLSQPVGSRGHFTLRGYTTAVLGRRAGAGTGGSSDSKRLHLLHVKPWVYAQYVCVCVRVCVRASVCALKSTVKTECTEMCLFYLQTVHTFGMLIYISSSFGAWGSHREWNKDLSKGFSYFSFCF